MVIKYFVKMFMILLKIFKILTSDISQVKLFADNFTKYLTNTNLM